jgi:hypothetical protein
VSEDAGIEPRTVATFLAVAVRRSNDSTTYLAQEFLHSKDNFFASTYIKSNLVENVRTTAAFMLYSLL